MSRLEDLAQRRLELQLQVAQQRLLLTQEVSRLVRRTERLRPLAQIFSAGMLAWRLWRLWQRRRERS